MKNYTFKVHFAANAPGSGKPPAAMISVALNHYRQHPQTGQVLVSHECISLVEFEHEIRRLKGELDSLVADAGGKLASYDSRIGRDT